MVGVTGLEPVTLCL